jgi:succinyl-CoA synthetase beta subunit
MLSVNKIPLPMKLYEFEGKQLLDNAGIPVPQGFTADSVMAAVLGSETLGYPVAVKAQVLRGGRGKAGGSVLLRANQT